MEVSVTCNLLEKEVEIDGVVREVYGLEAYHVLPRGRGIGTVFAKELERLAKEDGKHCVVAFCLAHNLKFWLGCGWDLAGVFDHHFVLTSSPFGDVKVGEVW